ncbi:MAG: YqaJ viral recombinase family protein [Methylophaga sp.]|nr:YqaJ viral recombinase family protein [Methylophaga sp.]
MKIINLKQGSDSWKEHRAAYFNASDAPVMMGMSSYRSRDSLLKEKATGEAHVIDNSTQRLFDKGHEVEEKARLIIEGELDEDLYPVVGTREIEGLPLSSSFDGLNFYETFCFEHKLINKQLASTKVIGELDKQYKVQMMQQMMIAECKKCLFVASDGTKENMIQLWYEYDTSIEKEIIAAWKMFSDDLKNWKPKEIEVAPVAKKVEALPALNVQITGGVTASNLETYEKNALAFIDAINTDLQTDSDFANAKAIVKFLKKEEDNLKNIKQLALEQTADIADLFKRVDNLINRDRDNRLKLDKLVKSREAAIKQEIVQEADADFHAYLDKLNERISEHSISLPQINGGFAEAVKNKRTIESLRNAVNTELARLKIDANELCDKYESNVKALKEMAGEYGFLFRDIQQIITKDREDLLNLAKQRIAEHKVEEDKRVAEMAEKAIAEEKRIAADGERIKQEEEAKAEENTAQSNDNQEQKANVSNKVSSQKSVESKPSQESDKPDYDYFRTQMGIILTNMDNYTKEELRTAFTRLADAV